MFKAITRSFRLLNCIGALAVWYWRLRSRTARMALEPVDEKIRQVGQDIGIGWAQDSLHRLGIDVKLTGAPLCQEPCLLVANHMSYLDILLWLGMARLSFVSKASVKHWPMIGFGAEMIGTVFVDRESKESRQETARLIAETILEKKRSIVVFPEGTTSIEGIDWRRGAFTIAKRYGIKVQAANIYYTPVRETAYIGNDTLLPHLWRLLGHQVKAYIEVREPMLINDVEADSLMLQQWAQSHVRQHLKDIGWVPPPDLPVTTATGRRVR